MYLYTCIYNKCIYTYMYMYTHTHIYVFSTQYSFLMRKKYWFNPSWSSNTKNPWDHIPANNYAIRSGQVQQRVEWGHPSVVLMDRCFGGFYAGVSLGTFSGQVQESANFFSVRGQIVNILGFVGTCTQFCHCGMKTVIDSM